MGTILESFVGDYLLNKVVTFVEEEVVIILEVKDEVKKLETWMRRIGAYLKDAERRRITDESINNWLNELKDVMYDIDDMIDLWRYNHNLSPSSSTNSPTCFPCISCFGTIKVRHEVAQQIKSLNARLKDIFGDMKSLNLRNIQGEVRELTRVGAHVTTPVIGDTAGNEIGEDAKKLVELAIMDNEQKLNLVAITGMGGIGKTTLAQKIYNNQIIQNKYTIRMWLHISQSYSPPELIKEAIRNARGNPGQAERESELLPILVNAISKEPFFLVLDDAWNPDLWVNLLQDPLKANATRGFILVTTRDRKIAEQMGANPIHQATILSTKSGWELLRKKAYLTDPIDIQNLESVGVEIVKKCGGLPLAIKGVAGVLSTRRKTKSEWENVLKSNTWSKNGLPKEIDKALYLSYEDLSPQLKQCFLYCSLFPTKRMHYRDIVKGWIAEGFIEQKEDQIMEDSAEECYYELIRRHLLEPQPPYVDQSRCRMHDLLRSLGQYLSTGESFSGDQVPSNGTNISRLRRLFITEVNETLCIPGPTIEPLKLRTFQIAICRSEIESHVFKRFKTLRALIINEKGLQNIPDSIGDLIHLRTLDLDRTSISNLPESIGSLTNLLFLYLSGCEFLHTLPRGITRLFNLHHLNLEDTPLTSVPTRLGVLQKLTEIRGFQVGSNGSQDEVQNGWDLQELEWLSLLRRISVSKLERARNFSNVLANKTHLKELILEFSEVLETGNDHVEELEDYKSGDVVEILCPPPCLELLVITNYNGKMPPSWMSSSSLGDLLPNLLYLHLFNWSCCTDLPPLGLLPNLKFLKVKGASAIVRISLDFLGISVRNGPNIPTAFPKLEHLLFEDMPNWEECVLSDFEREKSPSRQLMPRIKQLSIEECPKLKALPKGSQQLTSVEEIIVVGTHSIKSIQNLSFECESLVVHHNECLEIISNLPKVKRLNVHPNKQLSRVSNLDSLEYITLFDVEIEGLPDWLGKLMEERAGHMEYKLHLNLFCNITLFKRCLKDGPDWPIIKCFSSVNVYSKEPNAYLEYTMDPESYKEQIARELQL